MSQTRMTASERVQALRCFGYSESEASFLCLAALQGGYFLRRQYASFSDGQDGGAISQLIQKGLANEHIHASTWRRHTQLYHLCARPFYEALGQGDSRNRRACEVLAIKNKLMGLDFVLAHRGVQYLATEQEKLDYFAGVLKLDPSVLPAKLYGTGKSAAATTRYFVDKYPMFLSPVAKDGGPSAPPVVSFCFVDEGMVGLSRFERYLANYEPLFSLLPGFHLVYLAARGVHFGPTQRLFENFIRHESATSANATERLPRERLLRHFEDRRLFEAGQLDSFDRAKLVRLRQERLEFSGDTCEALYKTWNASGSDAFLQLLESKRTERTPILGAFSTFLLEHNYELFGSFLG
jgi:hypothetical protein